MFVSVLCSSLVATATGDDRLTAAIAFLIDREPGHSKKGDLEYAKEISEAIESAALRYGESQWLIASMAYWESHFRPDVLSLKKKGKADEKGMLQCGKKCAAECPHFLDTVEGQALCGVFWLDIANKACQSNDAAALTYYASGEVCDAKDYKPKRCLEEDNTEQCYKTAQGNLRAKVRRRVNLANKLKNTFGT